MDVERDETQLAGELLAAIYPLLGLLHVSRTISPGKLGILRNLSDNGPATTTALAKSIGVSQQAASLAVKELEVAGYIERRKDEADKRKIWLHLTERGIDKLASESGIGREALEGLINSTLTDADRKIVALAVPVLRKISEERPDGR